MGHEDKELVRSGYAILDEVINTSSTAIDVALTEIGSPQVAAPEVLARLPLMHYFAKALTDMLYHPAWFVYHPTATPNQLDVPPFTLFLCRFVKWGGCCILRYLRDRLSVTWFNEHLVALLRGLLHCLHDLTNQMGQGALVLAQQCSTSLVQLVFSNVAPIPLQSTTTSIGPVIKAESPIQSREPCKRASTPRRKSVATSRRGGVAKRKSAISRRDVDSPSHESLDDMEICDTSTSLSSEVISQVSLPHYFLFL